MPFDSGKKQMAGPPATTSFSKVVPHYDELMKTVPYRMWVGYYLLLLSCQDVHPETILDVGCGTGTMAELLTQEGFQMTGLDLSEAMIKRAKQRASRKKLAINYFQANAADFRLERPVDAAYSFFDSLNNIINPADLESAFECVYRALKPGGSWVFDVNTAYAFQQQMFDQQNRSRSSKLRYFWRGDWDEGQQIITVNMKFWAGDEEFEEVHRQRAYSIEEIQQMLVATGFQQIRCFHSYTHEPPRKNSDRLHFAAVRG